MDDVAGISSKHFPSLRETISSQMWVSVIDPTRFLAEPSCILDLDLNTVQEPDIKSYETGFCFDLNETGILNGFGLWFDVLFNQTKPPVTLSTAPWLPPTHWAQALWILPTDIDVGQGDEVPGTFSQKNISPSTASFTVHVRVRSDSEEKISFERAIEASPSNMNSPGADENHISEQAMSGAYLGLECMWIGCSMSCGTVVLPLPEPLRIDSSKSQQLEKFELTISVLNASICRFKIILNSPSRSLHQHYEQPISSMGHIVQS